jgi:hypothetical protein
MGPASTLFSSPPGFKGKWYCSPSPQASRSNGGHGYRVKIQVLTCVNTKKESKALPVCAEWMVLNLVGVNASDLFRLHTEVIQGLPL